MYSRLTISSLMRNNGSFFRLKKIRSTYSPIIPKASNCTLLNNMITQSRDVNINALIRSTSRGKDSDSQ